MNCFLSSLTRPIFQGLFPCSGPFASSNSPLEARSSHLARAIENNELIAPSFSLESKEISPALKGGSVSIVSAKALGCHAQLTYFDSIISFIKEGNWLAFRKEADKFIETPEEFTQILKEIYYNQKKIIEDDYVMARSIHNMHVKYGKSFCVLIATKENIQNYFSISKIQADFY